MAESPITFDTVDLPGCRLHLAEAGPADGPPVILLHGFPEFWFGWRHQIPALAAAGLHLLVPDQRGYNLSGKPAGLAPYHLDRLAADVLALADARGIGRFRLVGHDWGGLVAWWLASHHPERLERLAILDAPHPGIVDAYVRRHPGQWLRSWYVGFFQLPRLPEAYLLARGGAPLRRALVRTSAPGTFDEAELARYARAWAQPGAMTAMLGWYRALMRLPRRPAPRVEAPTLVLWGRRDHALQPGLAEASLALCARGRLLALPEAGHWLQHEASARVNAALAEFLTAPAP